MIFLQNFLSMKDHFLILFFINFNCNFELLFTYILKKEKT